MIALFGGSGFLGQSIGRAIATRFPGEPLQSLSSRDVNLVRPDATENLTPILASARVVIICAGIQRGAGDNPDLLNSNVAMALAFAKSPAITSVEKVVFVSSAGIYGEDREHLDTAESSEAAPRTWYSLSKLFSEQILQRSLEKQADSLLILRPTILYGVGDRNDSYGPARFLQHLRQGTPIQLWGDGSEQRDFLHIRDAGNITAQLIQAHAHGIVNLASGRAHSYVNIMELLAKKTGRTPATQLQPRTKARVNHTYRIDRLQGWIGSYDFLSIDKGLDEMINCHSSSEKNI